MTRMWWRTGAVLVTLAGSVAWAQEQPTTPVVAKDKTAQPVVAQAKPSAPVLLKMVEPQFSEESRKAHVGGDVLVSLTLDQTGVPTEVHIVRGVGYGLDEEAVKAVKQYRFKPAMLDGHPVPVKFNVEVKFQFKP